MGQWQAINYWAGYEGLFISGLMSFDRRRDTGDVAHLFSRHGGVGNLKSVALVQRDDELEGIHRIQSETAGPEEWLVVSNFLRSNLQHEVFYQEIFYLVFKFVCCVHSYVCS